MVSTFGCLSTVDWVSRYKSFVFRFLTDVTQRKLLQGVMTKPYSANVAVTSNWMSVGRKYHLLQSNSFLTRTLAKQNR